MSGDYPYGERRLSLRLLRYWQESKGLRAMPEENDIDPDILGADWEYCFLLQVRDLANTLDYNFTYLGKKIVDAYSDSALDTHTELLVGPNANLLSRKFHQVLATSAPVLEEGEFQTRAARRVLYRQCILPLGNEDKDVEAIFGGMNYKIEV